MYTKLLFKFTEKLNVYGIMIVYGIFKNYITRETYRFLHFSSPELIFQVRFSDYLSCVRLSVNSPELLSEFQPNLAQIKRRGLKS
jgi:hypothetical protein